jgi:hypothetical protein
MAGAVALTSLPPAKERLVRLMQELNFGQLQDLVVRNGQPVFDPPPRIVREVKFGGQNGPRPEVTKAEFALKTQIRELLAQLETLGNGVVQCLEVKHGLPFRMIVEEGSA